MARRQISLLGAGGLSVLLALAGCSHGNRPDIPPETRSGDVRAIEKGEEYVAIGDSYTSAPGTGSSADNCFQTTTNYPHKIAARLGLKLKDVSCGGATTEHVSAPQILGSTRRPPQADAVSPDTDLVTISLGANDSNIFSAVTFGCITLRSRDPAGAPCQQSDAAAVGRTVEQNTEETEQHLVDAIRLVAARAPAARIVVVGYPEFFPTTGPCAQFPLALGDYPFAHRINELLVRAQKRAAARTQAEYVDVFTASQGHDMCARDPWIAGLRPTRSDAMLLHPYPEEQRLVAELLVHLLTRAGPPNRERPPDR
ncbi:MAG TPA: SGNH/GDSL hydrolase family protein [Aeromicrobium sp.]|nr:SGNH/GDSL hydrolase family protein [Aeromicrobium sp.]